MNQATRLNGSNILKAVPGIYMILNTTNGKCYIGQSNSLRRRFIEHRLKHGKGCRLLNRALQKYGVHSFSFAVLEQCPLNELNDKEVLYIREYQPAYNLSAGGKGNKDHFVSEEVKAVLSHKSKQYWQSLPEEKKTAIIQNNLTGPSKGHPVTEETKAKLRLANMGKTQTAETVQKRSNRMALTMAGNSNGNKPILQLLAADFVEWPSTKAAATHLNIHPSNITKALKGVQLTAGGYQWKYKN